MSVSKYNRQGFQTSVLVSSAEDLSFSGMAFGPDHLLYVLTTNIANYTGLIYKFDPNSGARSEFSAEPSGDLYNALSLVFGPDGRLYVGAGSNKILVYDVPAANYSTFADMSVDNCGNVNSNVWQLRFGPNDNLYVSTRNCPNIIYFSSNGTFLGNFTSGYTIIQPGGFTFSPNQEYLYALDGNVTGGIVRFSGSTGSYIDKWTMQSPSNWDIEYFPDGNLYVSDPNSFPSISFYSAKDGSRLGAFDKIRGTTYITYASTSAAPSSFSHLFPNLILLLLFLSVFPHSLSVFFF